MPHTLKYKLTGTTLDISAPTGQPKYEEKFGSGNAPEGVEKWANGTANGTANQTYRGNDAGGFSIGAGETLNINLQGLSGELDALNKPLNLASVVAMYLELDTPGPGNGITIGPNGNVNAASLGFNAAGNYTACGTTLLTSPNGNGWTITADTANIPMFNPSATTQTGKIRISGVGQ